MRLKFGEVTKHHFRLDIRRLLQKSTVILDGVESGELEIGLEKISKLVWSYLADNPQVEPTVHVDADKDVYEGAEDFDSWE